MELRSTLGEGGGRGCIDHRFPNLHTLCFPLPRPLPRAPFSCNELQCTTRTANVYLLEFKNKRHENVHTSAKVRAVKYYNQSQLVLIESIPPPWSLQGRLLL